MNATSRALAPFLAALVLLSVLVAGSAAASPATRPVTLSNATITGDGAVNGTGHADLAWTGRAFDVRFGYDGVDVSDDQWQACARISGGSEPWSNCRYVSERNGTVELGVPARNATGRQTLNWSIVHVRPSRSDVVAAHETNLTFVAPTGDLDGDGLNNTAEVDAHTLIRDTDTDNDGIPDGPEVNEYGTDPRSPDTDSDGLRDNVEINRGTNPTLADTDGDGLDDGAEVEAGSNPTVRDTDGDGLDDATEVQLGTDPANALSPFGYLAVACIALVLGGVYYRRVEDASHRGDASADAASGDGDVTVAPSDASTSPDRPLTDEDHVEGLLEQNGGRLRQREIVEALPWSKAKVSRVLSRMEDDGAIVKIPLGRENLVCFPDDVPEGTGDSRGP